MTYENIKTFMAANGYEMREALGGYYYCVQNNEDGTERTVWMDSASEDAYNEESATIVAYDIICEKDADRLDLADVVKNTAIEILREKYPYLLKKNNIFAKKERIGYVEFGSKLHGPYGWIRQKGSKYKAIGFSRGTDEKIFDNVVDAILFAIKTRFHLK